MNTLECFECEMYSSDVHKDVKPVFDDTSSAICLVSSDEYAPFASLVIQGIKDNASADKKYDIVVLTKDMEMRNIYVLEQMASDHPNISIRVRNVQSQIKNLKFYTWAHFTIDTYLRLLIPSIFKDYDRVLYLDSDIIVNHDVADLLNIDMGNNYIAAAYDTHVVSYNHSVDDYSQYNIETLGLTDPDKYFQMGVALYNIGKINKDYQPSYLITEASKAKLKWLDQDFLNKTFRGHIKPISNKWNVMICNRLPILDEVYLPEKMRREYADARRDPYIVHYVGRCAPCFTLKPDLWTFFWKYARRSPYYEIILQKMALNASHMYNLDIKEQERLSYLPSWPRIRYAYYRLMQHISTGKNYLKFKQKKNNIKNALRARR